MGETSADFRSSHTQVTTFLPDISGPSSTAWQTLQGPASRSRCPAEVLRIHRHHNPPTPPHIHTDSQGHHHRGPPLTNSYKLCSQNGNNKTPSCHLRQNECEEHQSSWNHSCHRRHTHVDVENCDKGYKTGCWELRLEHTVTIIIIIIMSLLSAAAAVSVRCSKQCSGRSR